ncbi:hypothetical protein DM860_007624 [Cuscuta australis]|uniref:Uncharacterized protein n=1 Tax=Cuscuta australis TaxID=267555 RepID=A0A328E5Y4_9ASTE|nr:hypothetical protein DM860_007624 [Cuscuta australis]
MLMESFNILCKSPNVFEGVSKVQFAILEVEAKRLLIKFYYGIAYLYAEIIWSAVDQLIMEKALWSIFPKIALPLREVSAAALAVGGRREMAGSARGSGNVPANFFVRSSGGGVRRAAEKDEQYTLVL